MLCFVMNYCISSFFSMYIDDFFLFWPKISSIVYSHKCAASNTVYDALYMWHDFILLHATCFVKNVWHFWRCLHFSNKFLFKIISVMLSQCSTFIKWFSEHFSQIILNILSNGSHIMFSKWFSYFSSINDPHLNDVMLYLVFVDCFGDN